jgi:hypothetical protein
MEWLKKREVTKTSVIIEELKKAKEILQKDSIDDDLKLSYYNNIKEKFLEVSNKMIELSQLEDSLLTAFRILEENEIDDSDSEETIE